MSKAVTDADFKEMVLKSELPVMVDFWAEWCMPCRMVAPIIDQLSEEYEGRVNIYKMDIDKSAGTPSEFGIMSIPTFLFFKSGEVVDKIVGSASKQIIQEKLDKVI